MFRKSISFLALLVNFNISWAKPGSYYFLPTFQSRIIGQPLITQSFEKPLILSEATGLGLVIQGPIRTPIILSDKLNWKVTILRYAKAQIKPIQTGVQRIGNTFNITASISREYSLIKATGWKGINGYGEIGGGTVLSSFTNFNKETKPLWAGNGIMLGIGMRSEILPNWLFLDISCNGFLSVGAMNHAGFLRVSFGPRIGSGKKKPVRHLEQVINLNNESLASEFI